MTLLTPWWKAAAAALALLILAGVGLAAARHVWSESRSEVSEIRIDDEDAIAGAKTAVAARLPDADALNFGKVFVYWLGDIPSVCGEVDIDEQQDSFDGAERFIWSEGNLLLEEIDGSDPLTRRWNDLCK
ncbi:hypothetical protein BH11PSE1_BH11PSE1_07180 [soil metagenome]